MSEGKYEIVVTVEGLIIPECHSKVFESQQEAVETFFKLGKLLYHGEGEDDE